MSNLKTLMALVEDILTRYPQTRNCDGLLWLKVLEIQAQEKDIDLRMLSVPSFLPRIGELGFSPFESVRRNRQKLQAAFPHLAASKAVQDMRAEQEVAYRDFARSDIE